MTNIVNNDNHWQTLPKPFGPGGAIPYQTGWVFTFESGGELYHNRIVTFPSALMAKLAMRMFVAMIGENEQVKGLLSKLDVDMKSSWTSPKLRPANQPSALNASDFPRL